MRLAALFALVLLVSACDSAEDDDIRVDLRTGTVLEYETAYTVDTTGVEDGGRFTIRARRTDRVVGTDRTLDGLRGLTVVESEYTEDYSPGLVYNVRVWYRPSDERFEELAYEFYGDGFGVSGLRSAAPATVALADPALPYFARLAMARHTSSRLGGDDPDDGGSTLNAGPQFRPTPRIVVEYPAETGAEWTHYDIDGDGSWVSTREVVGLETVTTDAGTFRCVVVRTQIPFGDFEWYDWIADVGLVRRTTLSHDEVGANDGTTIEVVSTETTELVSIDD